ncbi:MAG: sigma-70 family RNA polymerase sigma factor [Labilithrix sp.]|nr:sigma-70 family RNA polymerase sigma factor [Labilithrix sp.]
MRPDLYRYCRHLTRSPWDAEDLAQEALMRAFVTLGTMFHAIPNPRAWLFRVASNAWIDRARKARRELHVEAPLDAEASEAETGRASEPRALREAAGTLFTRLSPQERAAVVLKDALDFSLEEIAEILATTVQAVKAALHRGRGRLVEDAAAPDRAPTRAALDRFAAAFNAGDLESLTEVLLDTASVEIVGVVTEYGKDAPKDPYTGSLAGTLAPITFDERGGVPAELLVGYRGGAPRCAVHAYRDGYVLVFFYDHDDGPRVRTVMTVDVVDDAVATIRNYFFTPDVIAEVAAELGLPYRTNGYRYWP